MNGSGAAMQTVSAIARRGIRCLPESEPRASAAGSTRSRAAAQMARLTAAWTAIRLAVKPMVSTNSRMRPTPDPSRVSSVEVIGSAT